MTTLETVDPAREVVNQTPPLEPISLLDADLALREATVREGGEWGLDAVREAGVTAGSPEAREHSRRAERNEPRLLTHDRSGRRIDEVELDPSWHWLLGGAVARG
ncbi:MAG: DNA alkylation response protein, partial [Solirubrobacteraceae bacterium]